MIYPNLDISIYMTKGWSGMIEVIDKYLLSKIYMVNNLENNLQYILKRFIFVVAKLLMLYIYILFCAERQFSR